VSPPASPPEPSPGLPPGTAEPASRHAALHGQPVPRWPTPRRWLDRLQDTARPRFLSSVLAIGVLALALALIGDAALARLWPWPGR
jgi:hypothetical protein